MTQIQHKLKHVFEINDQIYIFIINKPIMIINPHLKESQTVRSMIIWSDESKIKRFNTIPISGIDPLIYSGAEKHWTMPLILTYNVSVRCNFIYFTYHTDMMVKKSIILLLHGFKLTFSILILFLFHSVLLFLYPLFHYESLKQHFIYFS